MKSAIHDIIETLVLTLVIFVLVQSVVKNFRVEGSSMEPTLHDGEFLLVDKAVYWSLGSAFAQRVAPSGVGEQSSGRLFLFHPPERGDIIVFRFPEDPSRDFIKRVIGVPGDTVAIRDGEVFVNGHPMQEPYIMAPPQYSMPPERVPAGEYFVLGDNRNNSSDSHVWGLVPYNNI
ncbi:MAG TPA: signal peptidase I, partial [Chloroflexota bacterium]|nr:signal peptidase I [Chloroflexota bacterium]